MGGRTVESDEEDCSVEAYVEDHHPRRRDGNEDLEDRDDSDDDDDEEEDGLEPSMMSTRGMASLWMMLTRRRRRKKRKRGSVIMRDGRRKGKKESEPAKLEEDEIKMLEENNDIMHGNKFKRLRKAGRESELDGPSGFSGVDGAGKKAIAEEKLEYSLFGDQDQPLEDVLEEDLQSEDDEVGEDDIDDEMAGFIVDEDQEIDGNGQVVRKKLKGKPLRQAVGISSSELQEAHDMFGDVMSF
ncbi:transcription elongation factor SPT6 homolog isoform X3 [Brachypodium distachyon]|uniref:transcription elongation factor SPT6 homolog isoform X3 n=1 Tax=Brachypodium distachyon TaxID=15368 RepID=UPI00071E4736|nr:transcription elongation factor SPT6 homolog isoform X3 [Brachypodium distachyon]|eukprot:XP_014752863.1 transcription elongation factor SPT6 homolog isoform X3 [Brachypodium distachyon]